MGNISSKPDRTGRDGKVARQSKMLNNSAYRRLGNNKTCVNGHSQKAKIVFQDQLLLNAGQKYYRMLQQEHSVILLTCIELPFVIKFFILSIFEWQSYTGFTVVFPLSAKSYSQFFIKKGEVFHVNQLHHKNPLKCFA